jgi:predicted nucleic-acid-binding Zn-ribbon protein
VRTSKSGRNVTYTTRLKPLTNQEKGKTMRSYPIWNKVQACIYKSSKNWGAKQHSEVDISVGTSAKNSHPFLTHKTTRRDLGDGRVEFRFYVDNMLVKQAILTGDKLEKHSRFDHIETKPTVPECPRCGYGGYYDETSKEMATFYKEVRDNNHGKETK